jgi:MFS family permease
VAYLIAWLVKEPTSKFIPFSVVPALPSTATFIIGGFIIGLAASGLVPLTVAAVTDYFGAAGPPAGSSR